MVKKIRAASAFIGIFGIALGCIAIVLKLSSVVLFCAGSMAILGILGRIIITDTAPPAEPSITTLLNDLEWGDVHLPLYEPTISINPDLMAQLSHNANQIPSFSINRDLIAQLQTPQMPLAMPHLNKIYSQSQEKKVDNDFQKRLDAIGYTDELDERFYDPIMLTLMNNPVNAITQTKLADGSLKLIDFICDRTTYNKLKEIWVPERNRFLKEQPTNRLPIIDCVPCSDLKKEIDAVIQVLEFSANEAKASQPEMKLG